MPWRVSRSLGQTRNGMGAPSQVPPPIYQTAHDSTVGLAKPLGVRGAVMADTVGAGVP